jgi:archaellum component FlaC
LQEELHEKQKQEEEMRHEIEDLKDSLETSKHSLEEVTNDHDRLKSLCDEKDKELHVNLVDS